MIRQAATAIVLLTVAGSVWAQDPPIPPPPTAPVVETPPKPVPDPVPDTPQRIVNNFGIPLAPGEILLSVNGVPVNQHPQLMVRTTRTPQATGCPTCAPSATYQTDAPAPSGQGLPHQATAEARAAYMARNNYKDHPPGSFGTHFEGVGWTSRRNGTPPTCVPGRRGGVMDRSGDNWTLVGDAIARSDAGAFRVRLWNRTGKSTAVSQDPTAPGRQPLLRRRGGLFQRLFRRR